MSTENVSVGNKVKKYGYTRAFFLAKLVSKQMTIPIWKVWVLDRKVEPEKKVDTKRVT